MGYLWNISANSGGCQVPNSQTGFGGNLSGASGRLASVARRRGVGSLAPLRSRPRVGVAALTASGPSVAWAVPGHRQSCGAQQRTPHMDNPRGMLHSPFTLLAVSATLIWRFFVLFLY